jgi:hypothetical protein
MLDLRHE